MKRGDCTHLLKGKDPSMILQKILAIMEHQVTKDDASRHLEVLRHFLIASKRGFLVKDLFHVMNLFELIRLRLFEQPVYEECWVKLLELCFLPPILTKSMDILKYSDDIEQYFSWLGYMIIWMENRQQQLMIMNAIGILLTKEFPQKDYLSLTVRKDKSRKSQLANILGELLEVISDELYPELLRVIEFLIDNSKETCIDLLKKDVVSTIIIRLEPTWRERLPSVRPSMPQKNDNIFLTQNIFHVLTSLLTHATSEVMRPPPKFMLWSLQWAFRLFTIKETTIVERNNVVAVLLMLMDVYPHLLSGNLSFAYDIAMMAMSQDIVFLPNWTTDIRITTSHEDHSFMALLLMCISYFPNFLSGAKVLEECRVVIGLRKLIGHQQATKWHPLQMCYLIKLSLNILHKIISASTEEFIEDGGPLVILQLLNRSRENPTLYNYNIVSRSLGILALMARKLKSVRDSIAYNDGVNSILKLCEAIQSEPFLSSEKQTMLTIGFCLLEQICADEEGYKILPLVMKTMKRYVNPTKQDQIQSPKLIVICLSFIWNKIICSSKNSQQFVKMGGVYLILDIIHIGCLSVKLVGLGTLIDLCEKVECIPYLATWRRQGQGIISLLMDIFRQENKQLAVKTDKDGVITDYLYPLMGKSQFYGTYCMCGNTIGNAAIGDLFVSCRPKVYCLLQILNCKQKDTVDVVNEFYKLYNEELSVRDEVTYILADNFLPLKMGEEWKEIDQELNKMNIKPIPTDEATLHKMVEITNLWSCNLQKMQQEVLKKYNLKQLKKEQALYNTLKDACLSDAWDALCEMKYIARCSERLFRITSNFNLKLQIQNSLKANKNSGEIHKTFPSGVSVTCMHDQHIRVWDNKHENLYNTSEALVSPIPSEVSTPRNDFNEPQGEYSTDDCLQKCECDTPHPVHGK